MEAQIHVVTFSTKLEIKQMSNYTLFYAF